MPDRYRFYDADLWRRQSKSLHEQGVGAWRVAQPIPDMATTTPRVAYEFACVALAFLEDWAIAHPDSDDPIYIVDLGAGPGRFAFNFLKAMVPLVEHALIQLPPFKYIHTDLVEETVAFCQNHPKMQPFIVQGLLDFAIFDAETTDRLELRHSGETIEPGSLNTPVLVIANYFFSALRCDLFSVEAGSVSDVFFTGPAKIMRHAEDPYIKLSQPTYEPLEPDFYEEPALNSLLRLYQGTFNNTHLLIPKTGIDCLCRIQALSTEGVCLLSLDGGTAHLTGLDGQGLPRIRLYADTFYMRVNYHALLSFFEISGARGLTTNHHHDELTPIELLAVEQPATYTRTQHAFSEHFMVQGPDDIFELNVFLDRQYHQLDMQQLLAVLRLSRYDPRVLRLCAPHLVTLLRSDGAAYAQQVLDMLPLLDEMNYPTGIKDNVTYIIGEFYFELNLLEQAEYYFKRALDEGQITEALYFSLAVVSMMQNRLSDAQRYVGNLLDLNPNQPAGLKLQADLQRFLPGS